MRKELSIGLGMLSFAAVAVAGAMGLRALPRPIEALERGAGVLRAEAGALRYEAAVSPAEDRERLRARLDRHTELAVQPVGDDGIALELPGLSPGLHFVELELTRRGGRVTRFSDEVVSGPWQHERERGCDLGLVLGPQGVHDLLLPVVETKLLAGARSNAYFGPTSVLPRKVLEVVDGGLRFDVALDTSEEDKGDLRVAGVIDVRGSGDAGIIASLRRLDTAAPGPKLEALARAEGARRLGAIGVTVGGGLVAAAGGGTLLGMAVAAGGGLVGRKLGEKVGEKTARREVEREAKEQIERALRVATEAMRLPEQVVVLPTEPALVADLHWCGEPRLSAELGLTAALRLELREDAMGTQAASQAVWLGTELPLPRRPEREGANLRVDVSGDLLNRLLAEWVVRGGLQAELDRSGLREEVQASLGERTRWETRALGVELPPMLRPRGDGSIEATLGGVVLELGDPERAGMRTVVLGATGVLALRPEDAVGRVRLGGALDAAYLGCRERQGDRERRVPCFSAVLDPEALRSQLDEQLRVRSDRLPVLDLGALLRLRIFGEASERALDVDGLWVAAEEGTVAVEAVVR
ncbi:MAG: hypothetical protein KC501_26240 [Myxococcales bacterium]|nr:hypothetical protein [Myxococcales bacterium]